MNPKDFVGITVPPDGPWHKTVFGKDQPEYQALPALRREGPEGNVMTRWTFTDEEREAIAKGEDLWLEQLTFGQTFQPQRPTVGLPPWTQLECTAFEDLVPAVEPPPNTPLKKGVG